MTDRGEKIVNLAREIMRSGPIPHSTVTMTPARQAIPVKAIYIAALLSAFGGCSVTSWIDAQTRPLTRYERVELKALLYYAAKMKAENEGVLWSAMQDQLGVDSMDDISQQDYQRIRDYLRASLP